MSWQEMAGADHLQDDHTPLTLADVAISTTQALPTSTTGARLTLTLTLRRRSTHDFPSPLVPIRYPLVSLRVWQTVTLVPLRMSHPIPGLGHPPRRATSIQAFVIADPGTQASDPTIP
jgi:hypothetical protein